MSDTAFTDFSQPAVNAAWLNTVNKAIYQVFGFTDTGTFTAAWFINNLGLTTDAELAASDGSTKIGFKQTGANTVARTVYAKLLDARKSIEDYGGVADGVTDNSAAILLAAAATGGRFHFPGPGVYVCDSTVWGYCFTSGDNASLKISGVTYDISNAIAGALRLTTDSPVLTSLRHALTGNILQQWQNGAGGTATYFYRGLSIQCDSHSIQMGPASNGGSCDLLWQRSAANSDPGGNRFNITFDEANDRLLFSLATTASGAPAFDSWMVPIAGTSPSLTFPAVAAQFNQGVGVKQRAAGGFECRLVPTSSTVADLKQIGGSGTTFMSLRDGAVGFFGSSGTSRIALPAAATDAATTQTLVNAIRSALITFGLCS